MWFQDKAPPTDLVRQFVTEHRYGGADAARHGGGECRADGQPVTEVVDPVPKDDHPRHRRHVLGDPLAVGMRVAVGATHLSLGLGLFPLHAPLLFDLLHQDLILMEFFGGFLGKMFQCLNGNRNQ